MAANVTQYSLLGDTKKLISTEAIKNANPDDKLIQLKTLEALKEAASGPANKIFIPFEATKALGSLGAVSDIVKEEKATKKQ